METRKSIALKPHECYGGSLVFKSLYLYMYHKHMMVILVPCMIFPYTSVTRLPCKCAPSEQTSRVTSYHKTKVCCLGFGPVKKPGKSACFACCPHGGGYWWLFPGSGPQESNIPPRPPPHTDGPVKTVACLTRLPATEDWQQPGHGMRQTGAERGSCRRTGDCHSVLVRQFRLIYWSWR